MTDAHLSNNNSERTTEDLYEDLNKLKSALSETTDDVKSLLEDRYSQSLERVYDYTAEKPFQTLGIAVLVGFALGYILKR